MAEITVVKCCQEMFNIDLPSDIIKKRLAKFEDACDDIVHFSFCLVKLSLFCSLSYLYGV